MKIIAYTALHYGKDFLDYAIRSVIDCVDEYHILYAAQGSHGTRSNIVCPDRRHELYRLAVLAAGNKLVWHDGEWAYEGQQRDSIFTICPSADVVLVLDSDEVWQTGSAEKAIQLALDSPCRDHRIPMVHFWRSFHKAVIHDPAYPIRIIVPHNDPARADTIQVPPICHFGYCQRSSIILYKLMVHGHRSQFRGDIDWYRDRFLANAQKDCHPVGSEYWNPETVNPLDYMPAWMQEHLYFNLDVIP